MSMPSFPTRAALAAALLASAAWSQTAKVQFVHNAADPAAALVDVYVNGNRLINDLAFRSATQFIDFPAGGPIEVGVAPGNSSSAADTIASFSYDLEAGNSYLLVANGVLDPTKFVQLDEPSGEGALFALYLRPEARQTALDPGLVNAIFFHGATDAPMVDVYVRGDTRIVDNAVYGDFTTYMTLKPLNQIIDITDPNDSTKVVASYNIDLTGKEGKVVVLLASGFLASAPNQNGQPLAIVGAQPDGSVQSFPGGLATGISGRLADRDASVLRGVALRGGDLAVSLLLPERSPVGVALLDATGREVARAARAALDAGPQTLTLSGTNPRPGVYFLRVDAASRSEVRRTAIVR